MIKEQKFSFDIEYKPKNNPLIELAKDLTSRDKPIKTEGLRFLLDSQNKITEFHNSKLEKCVAKCRQCDFIRWSNKKLFNKKQINDIYNHINELHDAIDVRMYWDCKNITHTKKI